LTDGGSVDVPNAWTFNVPAIALVDHAVGTANSFNSPGVTTASINSTGASMLFLAVNGYQAVPNQTNGYITITDTYSNTWLPVPFGYGQPNPGIALFYCPNPSTGTGHTATVVMSDGGAGGYVALSAWSNTHSLVPLASLSNSGTTNIAAPFQGGSVAAGFAGDLVLSVVGGYNGFSGSTGLPASVDSGFTIIDSEFATTPAEGGGVGGFSYAYLLPTNTTPINPTWTLQVPVTSAMVTNVVFAQASVASVQLVNYVTAASGSTATTPAIDTTGANFLIASVQKYANTGGPNGITDSKGNTWTLIPWTNSQDNGKPALYYAYDAIVGTGHTFSTTVADCAISVMAFSGVKSSADPLESGNDSTTIESSETFQAGAAITPASAGDLVITSLGTIFATNPLDVFFEINQNNLSSGWTPENSNDPAGAMAFSIAQDNSTALQPTWSALTSGSQLNRGLVAFAVFKHA
jgi:hypothetical protein